MSDALKIDDFFTDTLELFDEAEGHLINMEKGQDYSDNYDGVFRALHGIRSAANTFSLQSLCQHMDHLISLLDTIKSSQNLAKKQVDYFLLGLDAGRMLLYDKGLHFDSLDQEEFFGLTREDEDDSKETPTYQPRVAETEKGVVFLVDDEKQVTDLLKSILSREGYSVCDFNNTTDLLEELEQNRPNVILSDIKMPGMTGLEMLKRISEFDSGIPVILISGFITKESMLEALSYGAYSFIEKPFDAKTVLIACKNAIDHDNNLRLLDKSLNYMLYQFRDLDLYLEEKGKEDVRQVLKKEIKQIIDLRKNLRK